MVDLLITDVVFDLFQVRLAHTECGETLLPLKELGFVLSDP